MIFWPIRRQQTTKNIEFLKFLVLCLQVVVPKAKGEILGVVIVESGWGSMLPTVVIANLAPSGAAARCGQLNIGDQIIAINGVSLVGLPLSTCQNYIKVHGDI
jgi:amyloid beta A4 precursor protein-binding family A member 1